MKLVKLPMFTVLSGIGWCIDFTIFNYLVSRSHPDFIANLVSASVAVTFVLFTSYRWIFRNHVGSFPVVLGKYVLWNVVAITAASYLLKLIAAGLATLDLDAIVAMAGAAVGRAIALPVPHHVLIANAAKILVTPFTMYANFVAIGYIIERRFSFV